MPNIVRRWKTLPLPQRIGFGFMSLFAATLATGLLLNVIQISSWWKSVHVIPVVGMALPQPSPRRVQFENKIQLNGPEGAIADEGLIHKGSASSVLGPLTFTIESGDTIEWNPVGNLANTASNSVWVFAMSEPKGAKYWGTGEDEPEPGDVFAIAPAIYVPESQSFPFHIANQTGYTVKVTLVVGINTEESGGGGDF